MEGAQGFGLGFSGDGRTDVDETHSAFVGVDARVRDDRDVRSRSSRSSRDRDSFVRRSPRLRSFGRLVFVRSFPADDRWMSRDLIDFDFDFDSRRPRASVSGGDDDDDGDDVVVIARYRS